MLRTSSWRTLVLLALVSLTAAACGDDGGSPTGPSGPSTPPPSTATRVLHVDGELDFGDVRVGSSATRTLRLFNNGTAVLTVTGLRGPSGGGFTADWTAGTIGPNGQHRDVTVRFTPTEARSYSGTFTIDADHTSGSNTKVVTARGLRDPFRREGVGNTVFDMPVGTLRVRITGSTNERCQNFIMRIGGSLVVNEILGTCSVATGPRYEGTHQVRGGTVEITNSTNVRWVIEELQ